MLGEAEEFYRILWDLLAKMYMYISQYDLNRAINIFLNHNTVAQDGHITSNIDFDLKQTAGRTVSVTYGGVAHLKIKRKSTKLIMAVRSLRKIAV